MPSVIFALLEVPAAEFHHQHGPDALGARAVTAGQGFREKRAAPVGGGLHSPNDTINNRAGKVEDGKRPGKGREGGWLRQGPRAAAGKKCYI